MKFEKGYNWFVGVAFAAGVMCCFLPQRSTSSGGSNLSNVPETSAPPVSSYPPITEPPTGSVSRDSSEPPESDSRYAAPEKHQFDEYDCILDCSGHRAGYEWAERKSISDGYNCDVAGDHYNSPSFAEGCHAYVEGESEPDDDD